MDSQLRQDRILILDCGGSYAQLVARRVRDLAVYCEVLPSRATRERLLQNEYSGVIITGDPRASRNPTIDPVLFELNIPILAIGYGALILNRLLGGSTEPGERQESGTSELEILKPDELFSGIVPSLSPVWLSSGDRIATVPQGFTVTARTADFPVAAISDSERRIYALQFHPEIRDTAAGEAMLENFLHGICGCSAVWKMSAFVEQTVAGLRERLAGRQVLCAFSGGVDSSVAAMLVHRAIGHRLLCIFVDHGLHRKNEAADIERVFREHYDLNLVCVDARARFLGRLEGVTDPETKRKIIGEEFIRVFEEEATKARASMGEIDVLVQGTIYPDVIESGGDASTMVKSHHNVGGLPKDIGFTELVEPLRDLFKDEVRRVGIELGMPENLVWRQPCPGPGLAVRIIGAITPERVAILQDADAIYREEIDNAGLSREISQYFAVLTDMRSVGVKHDRRTYDYTVALRAVSTTDFMTADWVRLPMPVLERVSSRIVSEVEHVNRVVYDITAKPPATIEWE